MKYHRYICKSIDLIDNKWMFYSKLIDKKENLLPIHLFKYKFSDENDIVNMFNYLNSNDYKLTKEDKDLIINDFNKNLDMNGCVFPTSSCVIIILNQLSFSNKTILHEFTHYFQLTLDINRLKIDIKLPKEGFPDLGLSNSLLTYILGEYEIVPFLYVDLIEDLNKLYNQNYKEVSKKDL